MDAASRKSTLGFWAVVLTQFLTTFNDNVFRLAIIILAFDTFQQGKASAAATGSTMLFLVPYALFSLTAGVVSDKYSKRSVFLFWKFIEIPIVFLGMFGLFYVGDGAWWAKGLLAFLLMGLGLEIAFLWPARYAILPEILGDEDLSEGNGEMDLGTSLGLLFGAVAANPVAAGFQDPSGHLWALTLMPAAAVAGLIAAFFIPKVPAANPSESVFSGLNPMLFVRNLGIVRRGDRLMTTILGLTLFWSIGMLFFLNVPSFGVAYLGMTERASESSSLLVAMLLGAGLGAYLAGKLSFGAIEPALAVYGAAGWSLCCFGLVLCGSMSGALALFFLAGMFGGMVLIPLNAFLEHESPVADRASVIATCNVVTAIGMLIAGAVNYLLVTVAGAGPRTVFFVDGLLLLIAMLYLFWGMQDYFIRGTTRLLTRLVYRVQIIGLENVPVRGPALICSNHISYADGNLLVSSIPRFIRFVVWQGHYQNAFLRWLGVTTKAVTVDPQGAPKELVKSLRDATAHLEAGELVAVFPEGSISRTGNLQTFQRGFEQIIKRTPDVPVIPVYIEGMWHSLFSYSRGRFFRKPIRDVFKPVTVKFGKPLPANVTAFELREHIRQEWAECYEHRKAFNRPLPHQFIRTAKRFSRRRCIADATTEMMTYGQTLMRAAILSRLLKRKLTDEQYVGIFVPPSVGAAMANLATSFLGKTPVNLNYTTGNEVLNNCIQQCEIKQVITSKRFMSKVDLKPDAELILLEDLRKDLKTSDKLFGLACRFAPAWVVEKLLLKLPQTIDDLATVIFSSGSTGVPKGVMLTQYNVLSNVQGVIQLVDVTERAVVLGVLPLFHSFGFTVVFWLPLCCGASTVFHYSPLEAEVVSRLAREHQATIFLSTATFLRGHIRKSPPEDFKSLELIVCGAEKLPVKVAAQFQEKFGILPLEGYGCTELSPVVSANRPDVHYDNHGRPGCQIAQKSGTIGRPIPGVVVKVADPDTLEPLPVGQEGLLLVKGPNVMKGYLHKPELTKEVIRDGWYNTGDIAKLDEDGFITITDRLSRFSKIGGEMVPHGKVEEMIHAILETHEAYCVVVGVPDPRKGEKLLVLHTPLPISVDELWNGLKQRGIPPLWLPAKSAFIEIEELPVLGTGKLDLKRVKAMAMEHVHVGD